MKSFLLMTTFLTRLPIKINFEFTEEDFIKGIKYLPIVGFVIGVLLWCVSNINYLIDRAVTVLFVWMFYIWVTGGLHLDGLADSFDGVFSNRNKEKILDIMKDSRIGTFGVIGIIFIILLNIVLSYFLDFKLLIIIPVLGRSCGVISCAINTYARKDNGMGKSFVENSNFKDAVFVIFITIMISIIFFDYTLVFSEIIIFSYALLLGVYFKKKIGGMTGDTIGAVIELSQTFSLLLFYLLRGLIF
ncbi:adenosylcobinamide-GDP ribazoletransferase [Caloranaerobacter azorensis]|uniref:Adenosylcobinamide-GDP ribazoletransferase n=1 Tax=Caloranaerobacter azorensis TaxID=116090 RepID=A0A6P1YDD8_9FIRM|nr:adenosylcobinamide-GDP ribazoletransferase [Caloranaerobacter azorensis]QIB26798.1 adenosylcobinamide-GDP ribazoletransferase [Caloranaerobacter azorensis]